MKQEYDDKGNLVFLEYSLFELEVGRLLFALYGGSTEPLYEQKARWGYIQQLKKMAQDELIDYAKYKLFWDEARLSDKMQFEEYTWKEKGL